MKAVSASKHNRGNLAGVCKCSRAGSSLRPTQHISRGFCPWKVPISFLTASPTCDLGWFLFTLWEYTGQTDSLIPILPVKQLRARKRDLFLSCLNGKCYFSWNLSSGMGQPTSLQCLLEQVSSHIKPQLPISRLNFPLKTVERGCPTSLLAQMLDACSCRSDAGGPQSFPELRSGAKVWDTQADTGAPGVRASRRQLLSFLPRDVPGRLGDAEVCRAPFKTAGGLTGPRAEPWGSMCSLPLTWPTLFILFEKKFVGRTCKW